MHSSKPNIKTLQPTGPAELVSKTLEKWKFILISKIYKNIVKHLKSDRSENLNTSLKIIAWWETKRIVYNLIVGLTGIITCTVILCIAVASEIIFNSNFGMPEPTTFALIGIIFYGIAANIFYTGGWVSELIINKICPNKSNAFATTAFYYGTIFSISLTLMPAVILITVGFIKLIMKIYAMSYS